MLCILFHTYALAIDCKSNLNGAEKYICTDGDLIAIDNELNGVYKLAQSYVIDKKKLKLSQKEWLKTRDECLLQKTDAYPDQCFLNAYKARMQSLKVAIFNSERKLSRNQIDYRDCQFLADISDKNAMDTLKVIQPESRWQEVNKNALIRPISEFELEKLKKYFYGGPYNEFEIFIDKNNPSVRFANFSTGGSCPTEQVFNVDSLIKTEGKDEGWIKVEDPQDEFRWIAGWGTADSTIRFNNQHFVVTESIWGSNNLQMVSQINNQGKIMPICAIKEKSAEFVIVKSEDREVCDSILKKETKPIDWQEVDTAFLNYKLNQNAHKIEVSNIDINNDGKKELIGLFTYESGGGCGSTSQWFRHLDDELSEAIKGDIEDTFSKLDRIYIRHDVKNQVFKINNQYYMLITDTEHNGKFSNNFFQVLKLEGKNQKKVCEFERKRHSEVSKIFVPAKQ